MQLRMLNDLLTSSQVDSTKSESGQAGSQLSGQTGPADFCDICKLYLHGSASLPDQGLLHHNTSQVPIKVSVQGAWRSKGYNRYVHTVRNG